MKTALLRTACGCEKIIKIDRSNKYISLPIMTPLRISDFNVKEVKKAYKVRTFEFFCRLGPESYEYREVEES